MWHNIEQNLQLQSANMSLMCGCTPPGSAARAHSMRLPAIACSHSPEGQAGQGGVAPRAAAVDAEAGRVHSPLRRQVACRVAAVIHIHNAPGASQAAAEGAAVARAAAIVDVGNGKACGEGTVGAVSGAQAAQRAPSFTAPHPTPPDPTSLTLQHAQPALHNHTAPPTPAGPVLHSQVEC